MCPTVPAVGATLLSGPRLAVYQSSITTGRQLVGGLCLYQDYHRLGQDPIVLHGLSSGR